MSLILPGCRQEGLVVGQFVLLPVRAREAEVEKLGKTVVRFRIGLCSMNRSGSFEM